MFSTWMYLKMLFIPLKKKMNFQKKSFENVYIYIYLFIKCYFWSIECTIAKWKFFNLPNLNFWTVV